MLGGETDKITLGRTKYNFSTWSNKNIVKYNIFLHWKGAVSEVVFVKFMTVIFSQRDAACF